MWGFAAAALFAGMQAPTQAAQPSIQTLFDQAGAAAEKNDWTGALAGYQAIEARIGKKGNIRSAALVSLRKGQTLYRLARLDEAEAELKVGLKNLPGGDESLQDDRTLALLDLATIAELSLRFPEAQARYADADRSTKSHALQLRALAGLVRTRMFDDPQMAIADADRAIALVSGPDTTKADRAQWRTLKGRALLNAQRFSAAEAELTRATNDLGGLTMKVDRADMAARSDLAIAAMLAGNRPAAQKYLAFTGAGNLKGDGLGKGVALNPPGCGGPEGLQPDDVAVIEFDIRDDGSVGNVTPIYASRNGQVAVSFARAVRGWSWTPEQVKEIDPFFRALTRLELRCSTSAERPSVLALLMPAIDAWMKERAVERYQAGDLSYAASVAPMRAELAKREHESGPQSPQLFDLLMGLATNPVVPDDDALSFLIRADGIARANQAPAAMLAAIAIHRSRISPAVQLESHRRSAMASAEILRSASQDAAIQADPTALAAIRIATADALGTVQRSNEALPILQQVVDSPVLPARDPLRVGALIRIAAIEATSGDLANARAAFEQTGLSAAQCALVDAEPSLRRVNTSSGNFPSEAMRWGFEGWATTEFDITAEGRTVNVRPIMAYPPFIFGRAAQGVLQSARFTQSYRPDGGLGCGGQRHSVRFSLPN